MAATAPAQAMSSSKNQTNTSRRGSQKVSWGGMCHSLSCCQYDVQPSFCQLQHRMEQPRSTSLILGLAGTVQDQHALRSNHAWCLSPQKQLEQLAQDKKNPSLRKASKLTHKLSLVGVHETQPKKVSMLRVFSAEEDMFALSTRNRLWCNRA